MPLTYRGGPFSRARSLRVLRVSIASWQVQAWQELSVSVVLQEAGMVAWPARIRARAVDGW